jgi:hypothetical protein
MSRRHDVSILIGVDGRVLGVEPRSKISMTRLREARFGGRSKVGGRRKVMRRRNGLMVSSVMGLLLF